MGSMVESNVGLFNPAPDALPGNVLSFVVVILHFLNLWTFRRCHGVAVPTGPNVWNRRQRASGCGDVTVRALQLDFLYMDVVREDDGLLRLWSMSEEMRHRFRD